MRARTAADPHSLRGGGATSPVFPEPTSRKTCHFRDDPLFQPTFVPKYMPNPGQPPEKVDLCPGKPLLSGTNPHPRPPFIPEKASYTGRRLPSNKGSDRKRHVFRAAPEDTAIFKRFIINVFQRLGYHFLPPEATVLIDYQSIPDYNRCVVLKIVYQTIENLQQNPLANGGGLERQSATKAFATPFPVLAPGQNPLD